MRCFFFALRGFAYAVRTQRNMRVHLCFAFYVILAGLVTGISQSEWLAVLLCIGFVTALECANTAVETMCDSLPPQKRRHSSSQGYGGCRSALRGGGIGSRRRSRFLSSRTIL